MPRQRSAEPCQSPCPRHKNLRRREEHKQRHGRRRRGPVLPVALTVVQPAAHDLKADGSVRKNARAHLRDLHPERGRWARTCDLGAARASIHSDCLATRVYPPARPSLSLRLSRACVPGCESWHLQLQSPPARATAIDTGTGNQARGRCVPRRGHYPSVLAAGSADGPRRACGCRVGGEPLPVRAWRGQQDGKMRRREGGCCSLLAVRRSPLATHQSPLTSRRSDASSASSFDDTNMRKCRLD